MSEALATRTIDAKAPLHGRVALVTGGSRGVGAGVARELAAAGAQVAVTYMRSPEAAVKVVADIEAAGGQAMSVYASAAEEQAWSDAVAAIVDRFGDVDLLVSNAGVASRGLPSPTPTRGNTSSCLACTRWARWR